MQEVETSLLKIGRGDGVTTTVCLDWLLCKGDSGMVQHALSQPTDLWLVHSYN